jgi:hypothetical protein
MTLSEYEQHTLNGIENNCRREDPAFVDRMNLTAAQQRSSRAVLMAHWAIWIGWLMLMIGGGLAGDRCPSGSSSPATGSP